MRTLVLLSGGIDSALALALAKQQGSALALGFDYGARHNARELRAAQELAHFYGVFFKRIPLDLRPADPTETLLDADSTRLQGAPTVVLGRNLILIAHAARFALQAGCDRLSVGCNATDRETYPDCRGEFLQSLSLTLRLGYGLELDAPLVLLTKAEIVVQARALGVPVELTYSCYAGGEEPCGVCGACWERQQAGLLPVLDEERRQRGQLVQVETAA